MHFAKDMLDAQKFLGENGHEAIVPIDTQICFENPHLNLNECLEHCQSYEVDVDKDHFNKVESSDAILVLNYPKKGINGYIGGATLMEIAIARHFDKKIFILHDLPSEDILRYSLEIKLAKPIILKGDLNNINEYLSISSSPLGD